MRPPRVVFRAIRLRQNQLGKISGVQARRRKAIPENNRRWQNRRWQNRCLQKNSGLAKPWFG